jgi:hypothetical protein
VGRDARIGSTIFQFGENLVWGFGLTGAVLFLTIAIGLKFGSIPKKTSSAAYGRARVMLVGRWICVAGVGVGLILMALASI